MARGLKPLSLGLLAVLTMSAIIASSASAHYVLTSANALPSLPGPATDLTGEQIEGKQKFTVGGQSVECATATFSGVQFGYLNGQ